VEEEWRPGDNETSLRQLVDGLDDWTEQALGCVRVQVGLRPKTTQAEILEDN
jgi:hypothetical protein